MITVQIRTVPTMVIQQPARALPGSCISSGSYIHLRPPTAYLTCLTHLHIVPVALRSAIEHRVNEVEVAAPLFSKQVNELPVYLPLDHEATAADARDDRPVSPALFRRRVVVAVHVVLDGHAKENHIRVLALGNLL